MDLQKGGSFRKVVNILSFTEQETPLPSIRGHVGR